MSELDDVADDLYAGPPGEFIARRTAAAKAARSDGDRELAAAIGELRKPTVSAWLVNLLVRDDPDLAGRLTQLSPSHSWNAAAPMLVTPWGIVTAPKSQHSWNADAPMLVTPAGITTLLSPVHWKNASFPMRVTPVGIVTLVRL